MAENVLEFTDDNFQAEVLDRNEPVLVDFWAPWCGPCKMLTPTIEELASDFEGKARVGKVNTDENSKTAVAYQINAIPTIIVFKNGAPVATMQGLTPKEKLAAALDSNL